MKAYITGSSAISPQQSFNKDEFLNEWKENETSILYAIEPDYSNWIDPKSSRRMSKVIKMSMATAKKALDMAQVEIPGAIIVGTALGCITDTEKFLNDIVATEEGILSPTAFIQSTHNTIAGQIALALKCYNHNFTYSNKAHSFENALTDALLQLEEGNDHILLGGVDENTPFVQKAISEMDCIKNPKHAWGEGAAFFVLSKTGEGAYIEDTCTFDTRLTDDALIKLKTFIKKNRITEDDIDVVISNVHSNSLTNSLLDLFSKETCIIDSIKVSGVYFTASAFALEMACTVLETQKISNSVLVSGTLKKSCRRVLICNSFQNFNYSFQLIAI